MTGAGLLDNRMRGQSGLSQETWIQEILFLGKHSKHPVPMEAGQKLDLPEGLFVQKMLPI